MPDSPSLPDRQTPTEATSEERVAFWQAECHRMHAEVERLRHDWHAQVGVLDDEVERLEIKVEQLREALRRFVADVNLVNVPDHVSAALDEEEAT